MDGTTRLADLGEAIAGNRQTSKIAVNDKNRFTGMCCGAHRHFAETFAEQSIDARAEL